MSVIAKVRIRTNQNWRSVNVEVPDYLDFPSSRILHIDAVTEWLFEHFRDKQGLVYWTGDVKEDGRPTLFYITELDGISVLST